MASPDRLARIRANTRTDLGKLKAVAYYGCLLVRPPEITGAVDPENPREIDLIIQACSGQAMNWSFKTQCCGGGLSLPKPTLVQNACELIVDQARRAGANCIVTACPMCHFNLDAHQWKQVNSEHSQPLPILYVTELVGLALNLADAGTWLKKHLIYSPDWHRTWPRSPKVPVAGGR